VSYVAPTVGAPRMVMPSSWWPMPVQASLGLHRGCGPAGGNWSEVEPLIAEHLGRRGVAVTVYDFEPMRSSA
jgi:hypothetical protein